MDAYPSRGHGGSQGGEAFRRRRERRLAAQGFDVAALEDALARHVGPAR